MSRARAKRLGLAAPDTRPRAEIIRKPLWRPNVRNAGGNYEDDPIVASSSSQDVIYHYQNYGNNYLTTQQDSAKLWNTAGQYIAFKCYLKPRSVTGRVMLLSCKGGLDSGGFFVDMVDGKLRCGWYDTAKKKEVWIGTDVPVVWPGLWHYIHVRKKFPAGTNTWENSYLDANKTIARDVMVCRVMPDVSPGSYPWQNGWPTWIAKPCGYDDNSGSPSAVVRPARDAVSFSSATSGAEYVAGCTATGPASPSGITYTGAAGGLVTAGGGRTPFYVSGSAPTQSVHGNMLWQWGNAANGDKDIYYVEPGYTATGSAIRVRNIDGTLPDFSGANYSAKTGQVFMGVRLVESDDFGDAHSPDLALYNWEFFGSHLSASPQTGVMPFNGEFASFALDVSAGDFISGDDYGDPHLFEDALHVTLAPADDALIGLDGHGFAIGAAAASPAELCVDVGPYHTGGNNEHPFIAVDIRNYPVIYGGATNGFETSTTPNEQGRVELDRAAAPAGVPGQYGRFLEWKSLLESGFKDGLYRVAVSFYDPEQADITPPSIPGPELEVMVDGDSGTDSSGYTALKLTELPISRDGPSIQRWIYATEANGATKFLVKRIEDNESTTTVIDNLTRAIRQGTPLEEDNGTPPRCNYVQTTQGVLAFGAAEGIGDLVLYSKPFRAGAVPYSANIFQVPSGSKEEITGMADFNGRLMVFKRDAVYRAILRLGSALRESVTEDEGCISGATIITLQGALLWLGEQGLYSYSGGGAPVWVSGKLESLFNDGLEAGSLVRASAALNRRRNQIVFSLWADGDDYQRERVTAEWAQLLGGIRYSRYIDPPITAMASLRDRTGTNSRLVAGTEDGYVVWMDRADTNLVMLGPDSLIWGPSSLTVGSGSTVNEVVYTGSPDTTLMGSGGVRIAVGPNAEEALVVRDLGGKLLLDRPLTTTPTLGQAIVLGTKTRYWKTKWLDMGVAEARKRARHIDVTYTKQASGTVTVKAYQDFGSTALTLAPTLDLTAGWGRIAIDRLQARYLQFEFSSTNAFELTEITLRVSDADPR